MHPCSAVGSADEVGVVAIDREVVDRNALFVRLHLPRFHHERRTCPGDDSVANGQLTRRHEAPTLYRKRMLRSRQHLDYLACIRKTGSLWAISLNLM